MAFDSTPQEATFGDGSGEPDGAPRPPIRSRTVVIAMVLFALLVWAFFATGVADAAHHALAHAFPNLMIGGCGGG
jgi:hypothetical protein